MHYASLIIQILFENYSLKEVALDAYSQKK